MKNKKLQKALALMFLILSASLWIAGLVEIKSALYEYGYPIKIVAFGAYISISIGVCNYFFGD